MLSHRVNCEKPGEEEPEGGEVCGRMCPAHQQHQALAHRGTIYTPKLVLIQGVRKVGWLTNSALVYGPKCGGGGGGVAGTRQMTKAVHTESK